MMHLLKHWCRTGASPIQSVGMAVFVIGGAGIASRLLGLLRDRLLAAHFGAGDTLDAYYAAFRIPDFIYGLLIAGALSAAFVPVFTETWNEGKARAWQLASDFLTLLIVVLGIFSLACFVFTPQIVSLLVPGFADTKRELTIELTRIMLFSPILFGVSAVLGSILVSLRRFLVYSLAPILYNLGIIGGIVVFAERVGGVGLAYGVVLGALAHLVIQWLAVRTEGFRLHIDLCAAWRDRGVRRMAWLMVPRSLGMAVSQLSLLVVTFFASLLPSGSLAVFTFAGNLQAVPLGLFGVAFSLAVFPSLSSFAAAERYDEFFVLLARTMRRILFFVVPVSVLFVVLRAQIVRVVLGSGQFNWEDTTLTFQMLGILAVSLFAQSLTQLFARAFFALQNTLTPLLAVLVSEMIQITLLLTLMVKYGIYALGLGFVAANLVNGALLFIFLRFRLRSSWDDALVFHPAGKIVLASLLAGFAAQMAKTWFGFNVGPLDTFVSVFEQAVVTTAVMAGVFAFLAHILHIEEFDNLRKFLYYKVLGRPETLG